MTKDKHIEMPYHEADGYVNHLVTSATEGAIHKQKQNRSVHSLRTIAAAAAVALLLVGGAVTYYYNNTPASPTMVVQNQPSPVDDFLNSLSDEDVQMLTYYELEEITVE
jgi:hypothetical protein